MGAQEVLDAVRKSMEADAEAAALDVMLYGRSVVVMTPDGVHRVPPEDWHTLADGIVLPNKSET